MANSNNEKLVILQIESPEGLDQVEKIAAIPGFDGFLFGPGDFSHRIGKAGQLTAPEVTAARQRVNKAALAHGKFSVASGLYVPLETLASEGVTVFNLGSDVGGLREYLDASLRTMNDGVSKLPKVTTPYDA